MRRAVIDASVVIARLLGEPRPAWVDRSFDDAAHGRVSLLAPTLLWIEVGNRLARLDHTSDERALEAMIRLDAFGIEAVESSRPLRLQALQLARALGLTMDDAVYLALARSADAPLLTLDLRLEGAAASMGRRRDRGSGLVSEPSAPYHEEPVDATSLATIGAALAEMRKEYSA